ncbi:MAG TPA: hypothetical protein VNI36_11710 [Candidatus Dormibacteraeota bacterium]|nr:hypothetical protein [Candidatus Dormibacteraeota bacterium]
MRKEIRYRLDARALFSWDSVHHKSMRGKGITRDVSVPGAFIQSSTCPPVDAPVRVEIILPSLMGIKEIRIAGRARVIRVERRCDGRGENGFAVVREDCQSWIVATSQNAPVGSWLRKSDTAVEITH